MKVLVTGTSGHLGEALARRLRARGADVVGVDVAESPYTDVVGSITDPACVRDALHGCDVVLHAATLHKPHVVTHSKQQFVDTNVSGTLTLLEQAVCDGVRAFVFTSSTSVFGDALRAAGGERAAWVTEDLVPIPKNIYGVTKLAAENLCRLFHRAHGLACIVLRTSRFFPDEDDDRRARAEYADANIKANEFLFRRVDLEDAVDAHLLAIERAPEVGFDRLIVSATAPFMPEDAAELWTDAPAVVRRYLPRVDEIYRSRGWRLPPRIDRVYVNEHARQRLGWTPRRDFGFVLDALARGADPRSELAIAVGSKLYHATTFADGPYPVD